jgi:glutathione S-transferase
MLGADGNGGGVRRLYYYPLSPYSRRVRLILRHKGLEADLVDPRTDAAAMEKMRALYPMRTAPVLVEEDGFVLGDSNAIAQYLDRVYPTPSLWPESPRDIARVSQIMALTDGALGNLIDLATRYYRLHTHDAWPGVLAEMGGRAQGALDALATVVGGLGHPTVAATGWSIGDAWLFTAVAWLEGLPARAPTFVNAAQILSLGWKLPLELSQWADAHRRRPDVVSL